MPRISLIGSSNLYTNNTCVYGSMAGLAPTTNVRPNVTGLNGYKVGPVASNQFREGPKGGVASVLASNTANQTLGCGLGFYGSLACTNGTACLKGLNLWTGSNTLGYFQTGRSKLLH